MINSFFRHATDAATDMSNTKAVAAERVGTKEAQPSCRLGSLHETCQGVGKRDPDECFSLVQS
jgi:hypothetical protein